MRMDEAYKQRLKTDFPAIGGGKSDQFRNDLMNATEDEVDFDLMNDETFGGEIDDVGFDWEGQTEKFAGEFEGAIPNLSNKTRDSGYDTVDKSYQSRAEYLEHNLSQLVVDDEDDIDDPAILNASKSQRIPHKKQQNLDEIFGPASPPGYLDTEHLVSPSSKNIWGSPVKDTNMPSAIHNLQSLFDFATKAATHGTPRQDSPVMSTPDRQPMPVAAQMSGGRGATLEEIEQQMMSQPRSIKKPVTAEELEREMRGEPLDQQVPQMPLHHPRSPYSVPPNMPPPIPGSPAYVGSPAGHGPPKFHHTPQAQRVPPGFSPIQAQHLLEGRRSPLIGATPPLIGSPGVMGQHRGSPQIAGMSGISPITRLTPSPPLGAGLPNLFHSPIQARMMSPYARSAIVGPMGNRLPTQPIGIPQQQLQQRPPTNQSPYNNSPGGQLPPGSSPGGLYHSPGLNHSPAGPRGPYSGPPPGDRGQHPQGERYTPQGERGYHHQGDRFTPGERGYPPKGDRYTPQGDRYTPQGDRYTPQGDRYTPQGDRYTPQGERYHRGRGIQRGYQNNSNRSYRDNRHDHDYDNRDRNNYEQRNNYDHYNNHRRYYSYQNDQENRPSDEYAGLMTKKEKDWIIKIQLMQLQTDNPYLDDFYYTTYMLKKKMLERQKMQQNGLNNKDDDPKLIIPSLGKLETRAYKPAQFEGSLGRLTTSSVHNPRQIIDVRSHGLAVDDSDGKNTSKELRRSRQLLMEIEKGYDLLLEVDDIEKRVLALPEESRIPLATERIELLHSLHSYLTHENSSEHFLSVMSLRKGRKLVARVLPLLDKDLSEGLVLFLLRNLQALIKRDQKEEGLMVLHDTVTQVLDICDLDSLVKFSKELQMESSNNQSKSVAVAIQNKFGSSVISSLLHRGETLYVKSSPLDLDNQLQSIWCQFVHDFAGILAVVPAESLVHPRYHHTSINDHFDRLLNKKLVAVVEDKVKLFTQPPK
ncbi:protein PAT1 homolog 1-like isoform X2 [Mizuhopecten yessoensis]|uniref:protein PAT1 homolog 1-like isoform X2 n=1 Tax=Mizuhopecten yessoensis TaxID=6573 RepID=UPI000B45F863|nr:protein PAT1 homolog 1-like isoform X2 [Mizuhopecten yessoensis]